MRYLLDTERPIFLHFLNREAAMAIGTNRPTIMDIKILEIISITHCSKLTVNISQMIEYSHEKNELLKILRFLISQGILISTSHDTNLVEFLESRQLMYRSVKDKYPMYFSDTSKVESLKILNANKFSMTKLLRRDILNLSESDLNLQARRAREADIKRFRENLEPVQRIVFAHPEDAITRANIEVLSSGSGLSPSALDSVGRMFSALYNEHYANHNSAATVTGIGEVGFEDDFQFFPHYDFPVLSTSLRVLGWNYVVSQLPGMWPDIASVYGGHEHRVFIEYLHAFLLACAHEVNETSNSKDMPPETQREVVINLFSSLISREVENVPRSECRSIKDFLLRSIDLLGKTAMRHGSSSRAFYAAWEANMPKKQRVRIALATATDVEDDALAAAVENAGFVNMGVVAAGEGYVRQYLRGSREELFHFRSSAGSSGTSGAELVSGDAIRDLNLDFVISVGICFGLKELKNRLCDVLVSSEVVDYEMTRVGEEGIAERGARIPAGSRLLSAARHIRGGDLLP